MVNSYKIGALIQCKQALIQDGNLIVNNKAKQQASLDLPSTAEPVTSRLDYTKPFTGVTHSGEEIEHGWYGRSDFH